MELINRRRKAFLVVILTSLLFFYEFGLNNIFNAIQSHISESLHLSTTIMGLISGVFFYVEIILLIPAGLLLDSYSAKLIILIVLILSAIGVLLTGYSTNMLMLVIARILMGIGGAFSFVGCIRIAVNWLTAEDLAKGTSLIASFGILGGFIVQTPLTFLVEKIGWRDALSLVSSIGFFIALIIFFGVKDRPNTGEIKHIKNKENISLGLFERFSAAFLNKQNCLCALYTSLMNLPIFMLGAMWGIAYLTKVNQTSELQASTICSMIFLGTMLGSPVVGIISDGIKQRKLLMQIGALISLIVIAAIIFYHGRVISILLILYFFLGISTSTQMLSYPIVIERNSKLISGSATSVISILAMIGGAVVQPVFGYIVREVNQGSLYASEIAKGYHIAMLLLPFSFVIAFITCCFIKKYSS